MTRSVEDEFASGSIYCGKWDINSAMSSFDCKLLFNGVSLDYRKFLDSV